MSFKPANTVTVGELAVGSARSDSPSLTADEPVEVDDEPGATFMPAKLAVCLASLVQVNTSGRPVSEPCLVPSGKDPTLALTPVSSINVGVPFVAFSPASSYYATTGDSRF